MSARRLHLGARRRCRAERTAVIPDTRTLRTRIAVKEAALSDPVESLVLDLLEWIGAGARPYAEVMDAWRTSCPRLPVWEDANERGFIQRHHEEGSGMCISVTARGREHLAENRVHR